MNSDYLLNSIYLPRKKPREVFIFPKINRPEHSPRESRMFVRGIGNKYQQNIFKMEPEKDKKVKLRIFPEETKERTKEYTRDGRSKECE